MNVDGYSSPAQRTPSMPVPQPPDRQHMPGASPGKATSSTLHDSTLSRDTPVSNQDQSLHNENVPSHALDTPSSSAALEPALRATAAVAPQVENSIRGNSGQNDHIKLRDGCVLNKKDYTVKFTVHQLPDDLAVRFLSRIGVNDIHRYTDLHNVSSAMLKGVALQMTDYWPASTDRLQRYCGPFAILFDGWMGASLRNDECAHCIWLRVRGVQRPVCTWQDWQNKEHVEACQQCVANGTFCMVADYGNTSEENLPTDVPVILPMPEDSVEIARYRPKAFQIEYYVNIEMHRMWLYGKASRDANRLRSSLEDGSLLIRHG